MAWRIEAAVAHGEIDNTVEGRTTGRIWLAGRAEPLILALVGDCWRDLAGTRLLFKNPSPQAGPDSAALDKNQAGIIGDMTASRRRRMPLEGGEELHQPTSKTPYQWRNTLYLEWFSEINGRVVIESSAYRLTISQHQWAMDEDAEDAQKLANLNSMRDFMAQVIRRRDSEGAETDAPEALDEFAWEERLKESDRLTDAYQEVLEKYMEDVDSEQKEAFVMGWDGLLDALAERDETGAEDFPGADSGYDSAPNGAMAFGEEVGCIDDFGTADDDEEDEHPLQLKAQELAMRAMDVIDRDAPPGTPSSLLITNLLQVSGKLAGALHGRDCSYQPEAGFVLAVLKRCLNWLNEAVGTCQLLMELERDLDQRAALEHIRSSVFEIRDDIVELRRELK